MSKGKRFSVLAVLKLYSFISLVCEFSFAVSARVMSDENIGAIIGTVDLGMAQSPFLVL
jgi:hypothetical protein